MSKDWQQQREGYETVVLDKARRDPSRELVWSLIMGSGGHKVGAEVSAVTLDAEIRRQGVASYIDRKGVSAQWKLLVAEGFLTYARVPGTRQTRKVASPEITNKHHTVSVYRIAKIFRTTDELAVHRRRVAVQREADRALADRVSRRTAAVRMARGLGGSSKLRPVTP